MRRTLAIVGVVGLLSLVAVRPASAVPLTINYAGQWNFLEFEWKFLGCAAVPEQCAFVSAMSSIGVAAGSPISLSLTFSNAALGGQPGNVSGVLGLGQASYQLTNASVGLGTTGPCFYAVCYGQLGFISGFSGPSLLGGGYTFAPNILTGNPLTGALDLAVAFSLLGPSGPLGTHIGQMQMNVVNTVPEPSSMGLMLGAIAGLWTLKRKRHR
jgi:hypothetical protein